MVGHSVISVVMSSVRWVVVVRAVVRMSWVTDGIINSCSCRTSIKPMSGGRRCGRRPVIIATVIASVVWGMVCCVCCIIWGIRAVIVRHLYQF
ncbi:unnamed protein product [Moneuplotes crassus]|uniref:Secreted peptide n=1 Tax=Euplotes crassus TaxID=5936 RepID=A0AAD2D6H6_EUPCR|nr:unnamed protein product [Moneuplotes crassus]